LLSPPYDPVYLRRRQVSKTANNSTDSPFPRRMGHCPHTKL
jgi:hypothetical protein